MSKNNKNHKRLRQRKIIQPFPCKDCITRPLCINKYAPFDENDPYQNVYTTHGLITALTQHCQLIKNYLYNTEGTSSISHIELGKALDKIRQREKLVYKFFYAKENRNGTLK